MPAGGIAGEQMLDEAEGVILLNGFINGVDTSAFASGDQVYVAVGGGYTNVAPTGSALVQKLGNVEKSDASNGSGVINGPSAARSVPNIDPGYTWVGNSDWVATPVSTASLFVTSASYAITSTSASHALNADNAISSSYSLTATSASHALASDTSISASHALNADNTISSSHAIFADTASFLPSTTNLNITSISASTAVFQSASIGYLQTVTGSATIIGDSFILLNTGDAQRYAGLLVEDSGSAPTNYTASFFYDSQLNDWNYEYTTPGGTDFGVALFGPEYNTKGSPTYLTANRIPKAEGTHHLNDSNLSDDGSRVSSAVSLTVTGSITGSDVTIDAWGSISASLASIEAGVATQNLQDVTDNGNTTTNSIKVNGIIVTGSIVNYNTFTSTTFASGSSIADATTNETLFTIDATVYESLTMDYVIFDSTKANKRAGTLRSTWDDNTSAVVFDETTTTDIGNTSGFTLNTSNNGSGTISVRATNNVGSTMTIIYERKLLG